MCLTIHLFVLVVDKKLSVSSERFWFEELWMHAGCHRDRRCLRRVWKRRRDRTQQERRLRLFVMNTLEIERILSGKICGVYSSDTLPENAWGLMFCNTNPHDRPAEHWMAMYVDGERESFLIRSDALRIEFLKTLWTLIVSVRCFNERQLPSICSRFVVIIVCIIVFLEVEDLTCVKFRVV